MFKRPIAALVCLTFSFSNLQYVHAQDFSVNQLPIPGTMIGESAPFVPLALKGLIINPQKPLEFQFIVDTGKGPQDASSIKEEATQLVKYFLAGLTIPEGELWVNLSPYEKNHITTPSLGQTELGRDLLAQDYILKQLAASLTYPEKDLGKEFWAKVYTKAQQQFGTTNIPVNTFNKVWILPDEAQVFENGPAAYVTKSTLKVMLDEDYMAMKKHSAVYNGTDSIGANIVRQIVIPEITKEVNIGRNFAPLRQIYDAMIFAKWYKETIENDLLDALYTNKNKTAGVNLSDPTIKEQIYQRYLQAYKKGVFNYIKNDPTPDGQVEPRKYFSGGTQFFDYKLDRTHDEAMLSKGWKVGALLLIVIGLGSVGNTALGQEEAYLKADRAYRDAQTHFEYLIKLGDKEHIFSESLKLLNSDDPRLLTLAVSELGELGDERAITPIRHRREEISNDKNFIFHDTYWFNENAHKALLKLHDKKEFMDMRERIGELESNRRGLYWAVLGEYDRQRNIGRIDHDIEEIKDELNSAGVGWWGQQSDFDRVFWITVIVGALVGTGLTLILRGRNDDLKQKLRQRIPVGYDFSKEQTFRQFFPIALRYKREGFDFKIIYTPASYEVKESKIIGFRSHTTSGGTGMDGEDVYAEDEYGNLHLSHGVYPTFSGQGQAWKYHEPAYNIGDKVLSNVRIPEQIKIERGDPLPTNSAMITPAAQKSKKDAAMRVLIAKTRIAFWKRTGNVDKIIDMTNDKNNEVKSAAAEALGSFRDRKATAALLEMLKNSNRSGYIGTEGSVAKSLVRINDRSILPELSGMLNGPNRWYAADVLSEIGDKTVIPSLVEAMRALPTQVGNESCARALDKLGWKPQKLEDQIIFNIAMSRWDDLVGIGQPSVAILAHELEHTYGEQAIAIAKTLGKIGGKEATDVLLKELLRIPTVDGGTYYYHHLKDHVDRISEGLLELGQSVVPDLLETRNKLNVSAGNYKYLIYNKISDVLHSLNHPEGEWVYKWIPDGIIRTAWNTEPGHEYETIEVENKKLVLVKRDFAMLTKKVKIVNTAGPGGIDLNQIDIHRTGHVIKMQFDPDQLTSLEQGEFEGFSPVIINMERISSPFSLLGLKEPAKEPELLAKA